MHETTGITATKRSNCGGHNRRLSDRTERLLIRASRRNPRATSRQLAQSVGGSAMEVNTCTIRRSLMRNGIVTCPLKSPSLSPQQCHVRLQWCLKHQHWNVSDWAWIIFSDETAVDLCPPRTQFIRRRAGDCITQEHTRPHRPFMLKVMFWGCISIFGTGPLIPIVGTMNSKKYVDTLVHLKTYSDIWFPDADFCYQQDNAPCHKTATVKQFFSEKGIHILDWPPYSPDLSCIENIWSLLKQKLHTSQYFTKKELISSAINLWENDEDIRQACLHVIQSMPRRIQECITSRGGYTHY